jgi:NAD(P)H-flavin reductase
VHESFNEYINPKIYLGFRLKSFNIYESDLERSYNSSKFVKSFYDDEEGVININQIFSESDIESNYFISGPPAMIKTFNQTLIKNGVPAGKILTDDWQ